MIPIYDRVYYTLYRMILRLTNIFEMEEEMPRINAVLMLSLLTTLNIIPILFLISTLTEASIFSGSKIRIMIALFPIIAFNYLLIFYKSRYKRIEEYLSAKWNKEKVRNILITFFYLLCTGIILWFSLRTSKGNF